MVNLSDELRELSYDEMEYIINSYLLWAYNTTKQKGIKTDLEDLADLSCCKDNIHNF